ncbi:MAG: hypothetical protein V7697_29005 [Rhodococcus erythropolis]
MAIVRPHSVLPDANIWCSATLHSWFGLIATETIGSWTFHWTEDILAEAVYHRRKRFPRASSQQIEALRDRLMASMGEWQIGLVGTPSPAIRYCDSGDLVLRGAGGVVCSG